MDRKKYKDEAISLFDVYNGRDVFDFIVDTTEDSISWRSLGFDKVDLTHSLLFQG